MLNDAESKHAQRINAMCQKYEFGKGVTYSLAKREDFNFEDVVQMVPGGCMERLVSSKSEGSSTMMLCCHMKCIGFVKKKRKSFKENMFSK